MSPPGWEEYFSAAHGGRPYYCHPTTGVTQWAEPAEHRLQQEQLDAAVLGMSVEAVRRVMAPLRTMQMQMQGAGRATHWSDARALLLRITGNIVAQPHVEKFRSLKVAPGSSFADVVYAEPGGRELMHAVGFVERFELGAHPAGDRDDSHARGGYGQTVSGGGGGGGLSPVAVALPMHAPLEPCRLAHCHIERSAKLTGDDGSGGGIDGGGSGSGGRWNNFSCSSCGGTINSGEERLWTRRWDAPRGAFRYRCNQCTTPEYNLCEGCWDALQRAREGGASGGGGVTSHDPSHTFEHVHPVASRHNAGMHGDGPWGNFGGAVSSRSRERLRDRTGL